MSPDARDGTAVEPLLSYFNLILFFEKSGRRRKTALPDFSVERRRAQSANFNRFRQTV